MVLQQFINKSCGSGWRSLIVFIGSLDSLFDTLEHEGVGIEACIGGGEARSGKCSRVFDFKTAHKLIGWEFRSVGLFLEGRRGWPGNLIASTIELVSRNGFIVIQVPRSLASTRFGSYFINCCIGSRNTLVYDEDKGVIYEHVIEGEPTYPPKPKPLSSDRIARKLEELAVNDEQARAIRTYPRFLYSSDKMFLIHGDRGRGKSSVMGLLASYTIARREGDYVVTSHSLYGVQNFFRMLLKGLDKLGLKYRVEKQDGFIKKVSIGRSTLRYLEPWRITSDVAKPLFIDEAASVGVARVKRWYRRVGKVVASTTIHGYEGSGRVLLKLLREYFHRATVVRLVYPVRYPPGDPLEEFLYKVFHLDAEPPGIDSIRKPLKYKAIHVEDLVRDYELLRRVYGLLVTAHYRNEPDDLVLLLDTDYFDLRVVTDGGGNVVAVAQLRMEEASPGGSPEELARRGYRIIDKLHRYGLYNRIAGTRIWRIVRIAVTPPLQRRGIGSFLLKMIEDEARRSGINCVGAVFSGFNILEFWLKNNYIPVYISPRYNRVTGEKNIIVLKPITSEWVNVARTMAGILHDLIRFGGHVLFRDLAVEKLSSILKRVREAGESRQDIEVVCKRLENYLERSWYHESVMDILFRYIDLVDYSLLSREELVATIARVIQGKTLSDINRILYRNITRTQEFVEQVMKKIAREIYRRICR